MNKLQEAIQKFSENLAYDSDDTHLMYFDCSPDTIKEGLAKIIVEYARSKVPEKVEDFSNEDSYADIYTGHNECIGMFISSIEQDLLSLKEQSSPKRL